MKKWVISVSLLLAISLVFIPSKSRSFIREILKETIKPFKLNDESPNSTDFKKIEGFEFKMIFEPAEKRAKIINGGREPEINQIQEGEKLICYELRISSEAESDILKISNEFSFEQRLSYFMSGLQKDLILIVGKDTLPCILYHFERNFGIAPYLSLHTGFASPKNWKKLPHHLVIKSEYFHFGDIHLESNNKNEIY